jgi:hypothetical protein
MNFYLAHVKCKICKKTTSEVFGAEVLRKYQVKYYHCSECGFIQPEEPYWLQEAYESPLNTEDTGILKRNEYFRSRVTLLLKDLFDAKGKFLDYGGGYGVFTRLMRDVGFNYFWQDKYAQNILSRGFSHEEGVRYEAISAFEVFEHLLDVDSEVDEMLKYSDTIVFSTLLHGGDEIPLKDWWYYAFNHGQHISLFTLKSLEILATSKGLKFYSNGINLHIFTKLNYSNQRFKRQMFLAKWFWFFFKGRGFISKTNSDFELLSNS